MHYDGQWQHASQHISWHPLCKRLDGMDQLVHLHLIACTLFMLLVPLLLQTPALLQHQTMRCMCGSSGTV